MISPAIHPKGVRWRPDSPSKWVIPKGSIKLDYIASNPSHVSFISETSKKYHSIEKGTTMAKLSIKALHLFSAPISGCSARIRIISHLKSIPLIIQDIDFSANEYQSEAFLAINPNATIPVLRVDLSSSESFTITQSPAIIDFLEQHYPDPPLLPSFSNWQERARVIELASLVAMDIHPAQSVRIRKKIASDFHADAEKWAKYVYERGFAVYEKFLETGREKGLGGKFSVGDEVSMADIYLMPVVQGSLRVGVELDKWPLLKKVVDECWKVEAFRKGGVGGEGKLCP